MTPAILCFLLVGSAVVLGADPDDSIVKNSPLDGTNFRRSLITNSQLTKCNVVRSGILASVAKGSTIVYSFVRNSTISGSILNVTYSDPVLDNTRTDDVFRNIDRHFFNRVFDSEVVNSEINASPNCLCTEPGFNSSIYKSRISNSKVRRSEIVQSNLTEDSNSCRSVIGLSELHRADVRNSVLRKMNAKACTLSNTVAEDSFCEGSRVANGKLNDASVQQNSYLGNSVVNGHSQTINTTVKNSVISHQSKIVGSEIVNSKVSNSRLSNCIIINSNVNGKTWDSMKMVNGMIVRSQMNTKQISWFY